MKLSVLSRLSLVNAVGFSASTVMPLWLTGVAQRFHQPPWFAGAAVVAQIGGAATFNLLTPLLFRRWRPLTLARAALALAAAAYLLAATGRGDLFLPACLGCGAALGVVLNVTNRLMGSAEHAQRGYALFVLIEVLFATLLFLGSAAAMARFGLLAVFPVVSGAALLALLALTSLKLEAAAPARLGVVRPPARRGAAILGLVSFALFFTGQAALNAFMPTIGQAAGLSAGKASALIGLGMPSGFAGALAARGVGERVRPALPVVAVALALAALAPLLTLGPRPAVFVGGEVVLSVCTIFVVPYFFAELASLDRSGRYAAFGPAMMLTGIACGPSAAVMLHAGLGLPAVGVFAAALLALGAAAFLWAARRAPLIPSVP